MSDPPLTPDQINSLWIQLQQANLIIEQLRNERAEIQPTEAVTQSTHVPHYPSSVGREPKVNPPDQFFGEKEKMETFLAQLQLSFQLQSSCFPDDKTKILFAVSYMKGTAFNWALPYIQADHTLLTNYEEFLSNFRATFGDINRPRQAARELLDLKQGHRPVVAYITDFQRLSIELDWSNSLPLLDMFDKGLNKDIKQALCNFERPTLLEDYYNLVARIDNRQIEFRHQFDGVPKTKLTSIPMSNDGVVDMVIGTSQRRGPLSLQERQRRMEQNLCLYCGEEGHIIASCPKRFGQGQQRHGPTKNKNLIGTSSVMGHQRLYLPVELLVSGQPINLLHALVDSGADKSLVDEKLLRSLNIPFQQLQNPITFETIEGTPFSSGTIWHFAVLELKSKDITFTHTFYVLHSVVAPVILGIDWLMKFNPTINWSELSIEVKQSCFNPVSQLCAVEEKNVPNDNPAECFSEVDVSSQSDDSHMILTHLPIQYHQYASVFSKQLAEVLPEHRKFDIGIDIQEGKKVPWGPIYPLSDPELTALRVYLDDQLKKGFIRSSQSPSGAPIFFVKKKSGELRPVIDYRGLNAITKKNQVSVATDS